MMRLARRAAAAAVNHEDRCTKRTKTDRSCRAKTHALRDALVDIHASRVDTPLFRYGPLPVDNVLTLPPGTQSDAVGAGYVVVLPPFSAGVHRIRAGANVFAFGIAVDTELIVTVEPPSQK